MWSTFIERSGVPPEEIGELAEPLARAVADATAAWPQLAHPGFAAALGARFGAERQGGRGVSAALWFERLHPADLYLASACADGVPGAAALFEATFRDDLRRTGRRFEDGRHPADDLVQTMLQRLLVGTGDIAPKLGEYAGQGPLRSWLRVVATRMCIDAVKGGAQHRREHATDTEALAAADLADDVELGFLKAAYRARFKVAFAEAVGRLEASERTLLKLSALRGLSIDEIGALFHVHRATAARRIAHARERLLGHTRSALAASLSVGDDELDSIIGLIDSRLEVSLERLLDTNSKG